MTKRIPPSAEQIEQAVTDHLMSLPADKAFRTILPMLDARRVVAKAFNTSHAKAYDWLLDIAAGDTHPVEVLRIGGSGVVSSVMRAGERPGTIRFKNLGPEYGHTLMTSGPRVRLDWCGGVIDPPDGKYDPLAERPADDAVFVAVTKLFRPFVQESAEHYLGQKVAREGEQILTAATVEHHHGEGLAYIRGLLDAAIVHHPGGDDELLRVGRAGKEGRVTIELVGDAIDKLGSVLRDLGVQPKKDEN